MVAAKDIVREYQDGPDYAADRAVEQAYRQSFVDEAGRMVREWAHPPGPLPPPEMKPVSMREILAKRRCDPLGEEERAGRQRHRLRERYTVYGPGDAGPKTHHLGYRPGHEVPAARLRGRQHAMAYVTNLWKELETADLDIFDPKLLCPWLRAVEMWATAPIRPDRIVPPPRPLEVVPEFQNEEPAMPAPAPIAPWRLPPSPQGNLVTPPAPPPPRIRLTRADQIEIRPPHWLLRGMLERDTFALIFGDPGCGKSFLAIDWACRIATGTPWRGQPVNAGPVVYIAGEGQQGFGRRICAWSEHHGVSLAGVPLYQVPAVAIPDAIGFVSLTTAIDAGVVAVGQPVMIVLDTLARCFGGGDENSTQDMSKFVSACDAIRQRYNCTILVIHHAGHGDKSRARGAIALKAALDAEYRLDHENGLLLTATKMKDAEMPVPVAMKLVSVELPDETDEDGNPVTSAVVEVLDADTSAIVAQVKAAGQRGKWQKMGLKIARRLIEESDDGQVRIEDWHEACESAGMQSSTRYSVLAKLHEQGMLVTDGAVITSS